MQDDRSALLHAFEHLGVERAVPPPDLDRLDARPAILNDWPNTALGERLAKIAA